MTDTNIAPEQDNLIDKALRYLDMCEMEEPLWNIYHGLLDNDQEESDEFVQIDLRLARIASEKTDIEFDFDNYIAGLPEHERWRYDSIRRSDFDCTERYIKIVSLYIKENDETEPVMSNEQIATALAEAPNYGDVDAFVSDMLTSSLFLDPEDEDAEIAMELVEPLHKLWHVACDPFIDFLSALGLRRVDCAKQFFIPLRTVEDWIAERRTPTIYLKMMMARLCGYIE